jgi:short-subunit dehydrogenase
MEKAGNMQITIVPFDFKKDSPENLTAFLPDTVDILINNAGTLVNKPFSDISLSEIDEMLNVNFKAPSMLIQSLISKIRHSPIRHVVNIGSMGGFQGSSKYPGLSVYSASKAALAVMTECLAVEYSHLGIRFNCLALGAVQTEMLTNAFPTYTAPLQPNEMAQFIADFALSQWKYFNGKVLPVAVTNP